MPKKSKILLITCSIILLQLLFFHDYIFPIQWGQIKVSGLSCTCPDETVVNGQIYLRAITPDSLKQYNLDYSEIYVTEKPSTFNDPMGADLYFIKGSVIGKDRVSENDSWNPIFKVDKWREVDIFKDYLIKLLLFVELIIIVVYCRKLNKK